MIIPVFLNDLVSDLDITTPTLYAALRKLRIKKRRYKQREKPGPQTRRERYFSQKEAAAIAKLIESGKNIYKELPPERSDNFHHSWHRVLTWT